MELKLDVVEGDRKREAFSNPIINWRYKITTGPRCLGMVSTRKYESVSSAFNAGQRMLKKLRGTW